MPTHTYTHAHTETHMHAHRHTHAHANVNTIRRYSVSDKSRQLLVTAQHGVVYVFIFARSESHQNSIAGPFLHNDMTLLNTGSKYPQTRKAHLHIYSYVSVEHTFTITTG